MRQENFTLQCLLGSCWVTCQDTYRVVTRQVSKNLLHNAYFNVAEAMLRYYSTSYVKKSLEAKNEVICQVSFQVVNSTTYRN